jgi:hypothetical protein
MIDEANKAIADLLKSKEELERQADILANEIQETDAKLKQIISYCKMLQAMSEDVMEMVHNRLGYAEEPPEEPKVTHFARIKIFLYSQENKPQTLAQLEAGTGIPKSSISAVLYRTHSEYFGSTEQPGQSKAWYVLPRFALDDIEAGQLSDASQPVGGDDIPF